MMWFPSKVVSDLCVGSQNAKALGIHSRDVHNVILRKSRFAMLSGNVKSPRRRRPVKPVMSWAWHPRSSSLNAKLYHFSWSSFPSARRPMAVGKHMRANSKLVHSLSSSLFPTGHCRPVLTCWRHYCSCWSRCSSWVDQRCWSLVFHVVRALHT